MIERFNFYDIYGYLLPGLALCGLLGLPLALIAGKLPPAELGSALAAAVIGYIVGQVAHAFARRLFTDQRPFASQVAALPQQARDRLREKLVALVGWNIETSNPAVFWICRRALQDRGRVQAAEQFQGMYALARGIALAFYAATAYYAGVWIAALTAQQLHLAPLLGSAAVLAWLWVAFNNQRETATGTGKPTSVPGAGRVRWMVVERFTAFAALVLLGDLVGSWMPMSPHRAMAFGVAIPGCLLVGLRMHRVCTEHDVNVAKTILNDFMVEASQKSPSVGWE